MYEMWKGNRKGGKMREIKGGLIPGLIIEIVDLPERCSCGSEKGSTGRVAIEAPDGKLLKEVRCKGCGKKSLIPDKLAEWQREREGDKYRPTWYYQPETSKIIHWSEKKGAR